MVEDHIRFPQPVNIGPHGFGIRRDDRAIVTVFGGGIFLHVIGNAGVENLLDALPQQVGHVSVHQLGRITDRIGRNRVHALFVELPGGTAGQDYLIVEAGKQREPEGIILIQVEDAGNADPAAPGLPGRQRLVAEQALVLVSVKVGGIGDDSGFTDSPLATVARMMFLAIGKGLGGDQALVAAKFAAVARRPDHKPVEGGRRQQGGRCSRSAALAGDKGCAESAHESGDIRTDYVLAQDLLESPQHRVVVEGSALDHDAVAEFGGVFQADDLEQGVLDDGNGDARRDVPDIGAFFLHLLDFRIHEYCAAGAKIHRFPSGQAETGELFHA